MAPGKYFSIRSQGTDLFWDVEGPEEESEITLNERDPGRLQNQLFYEDILTGTIRAKINNFCVHVKSRL